MEMETVDLSRLPQEVADATDFLRLHVNGRVKPRGTKILVDGLKHREVKLLLHKFLRHNNLDGYRVVSQAGVLEIVPPHMMMSSKHEKGGTPPPAALTMPYFFPGSPPVPIEKKIRKRED
jgi:hypothetical protein